MHRIVILGGGFAGIAAAHTFAKLLRPGEAQVDLFESQGAHGYTPLFFETAAIGMERARGRVWAWDGAALPFTQRGVWSTLHRVRLHREEVVHVDAPQKRVRLKNGETIEADAVVFALGSTHTMARTPGASEHAVALKSLADVALLQRRVSELAVRGGLAHVVVVGSGAVALEFAAQMAWQARRHAQGGALWNITVLEVGDRVCAQAPRRASRLAAARLAELGVQVRLGVQVWQVDSDAVRVREPSGVSESIHADLVVWAGGVAPRASWGEWGLPVDAAGWVCVDEHFQVEGLPGLYAAGDMIVQQGRQTPRRAPMALAQGEAAARAALRALRGAAPMRPSFLARRQTWPMAMPMGGRWGIAIFGPLVVGGYLGWCVRTAADLQYFFTVLTWREAWKRLWAGTRAAVHMETSSL
jgi:NADH dehydrogenase